MWRLTVGCGSPSARAALPKCRCSATARNERRWRSCRSIRKLNHTSRLSYGNSAYFRRVKRIAELRAVGMLVRVAPGLAASALALMVADALLPNLVIVVMGQATGRIPGAVEHGLSSPAGHALERALALAGVVYTLSLLRGPAQSALAGLVRGRMTPAVQGRMVAAVGAPVGVAHLEDPAVADKLASVSGELRGDRLADAPMTVLAQWGDRLGGLFSCVVLMTFRVWVGVLLALVWLAVRRPSRAFVLSRVNTFRHAATPLRHAGYLLRLASGAAAAKEVRVFEQGRWLVEPLPRALAGRDAPVVGGAARHPAADRGARARRARRLSGLRGRARARRLRARDRPAHARHDAADARAEHAARDGLRARGAARGDARPGCPTSTRSRRSCTRPRSPAHVRRNGLPGGVDRVRGRALRLHRGRGPEGHRPDAARGRIARARRPQRRREDDARRAAEPALRADRRPHRGRRRAARRARSARVAAADRGRRPGRAAAAAERGRERRDERHLRPGRARPRRRARRARAA